MTYLVENTNENVFFLNYAFLMYGKNAFDEVFKNLARYRSKNNIVEFSNLIYKLFRRNQKYCTKF